MKVMQFPFTIFTTKLAEDFAGLGLNYCTILHSALSCAVTILLYSYYIIIIIMILYNIIIIHSLTSCAGQTVFCAILIHRCLE